MHASTLYVRLLVMVFSLSATREKKRPFKPGDCLGEVKRPCCAGFPAAYSAVKNADAAFVLSWLTDLVDVAFPWNASPQGTAPKPLPAAVHPAPANLANLYLIF